MFRNLAAEILAFTSNVFLVTGTRTVLVDPGANFDIVPRIERHVDDLDAIVITHTHPDHIGNTEAVVEHFDVETWGFDTDHDLVDNPIAADDTVTIGDHDFVAWHTPGHKNDHLCFYAADPKVLIAGDLIFQNGGYGRTDLEEGNHRLLVESIKLVADRTDEDLTALHPGHGPSITEAPYHHIELALQMAQFG